MYKLKLEMADVVRAHMDIPGCPVLTSNQCHTLAMKLNEKLDFDAIARADEALRSDADLQKELGRCASMAEMVREREWAEHVGEGHVSTCVELAFTQLHNELYALQERLDESEKRANALAAFGVEMVSASREGGSFDGGDIQDLAVKHGLLVIEPRQTECGEHCACSEYGFPADCYRNSPLLASPGRADQEQPS